MSEIKKRIWKFDALDRIQIGPKIVNDTVIIGLYKGQIYSVNITTGEKCWSLKLDCVLDSMTSILVNESILFVGAINGKIYAISAKTGKGLWEFKTDFLTGNTGISKFSVENGVVYFGNENGYLYGVDIPSGELVWKQYIPSIISNTIISNNLLFFWHKGYVKDDGGTSFSPRDNGYLKVIDVKSNEQIWDFNINNNPGLIKKDNHVFIFSDKGIYSINTKERKIEWENAINNPYNPLKIINKQIYFCQKHSINSIDIETGQIELILRTESYPIIEVTENKLLYIKSGIVTEIDIESKKTISKHQLEHKEELSLKSYHDLVIYKIDRNLYCYK